jgi:hypothetical protein
VEAKEGYPVRSEKCANDFVTAGPTFYRFLNDFETDVSPKISGHEL